jgi:hypothetical protein
LRALSSQAVSRQLEVTVGLFIIGALVVMYLLGAQAGREGPARSKHLQEIVSKKAEVKNLESQLASNTTSPIVHMLVMGFLAFVLLKFLGLWNSDDDDYRYRGRRR